MFVDIDTKKLAPKKKKKKKTIMKMQNKTLQHRYFQNRSYIFIIIDFTRLH